MENKAYPPGEVKGSIQRYMYGSCGGAGIGVCDWMLRGSLVLGKSLTRRGPWSARVLVALLPVFVPRKMNVERRVEKPGYICGWAWIVGIFLDGC